MNVKDIPRHKTENPFNYTDDELAEKALALEKMKTIYKDVPLYYAELVYDLCKNTDQAKIEEIKQKIENTPFKYDYSNLQEELNKVKDSYPTEQKVE
jgi:anti-sigma28 factor (negative regulator of flagellin synthesis)